MSWSNNLVFGLCYIHQQLLAQARLALEEDLVTFLPPVADPLEDLTKNVLDLFKPNNVTLDLNGQRLAQLTLFPIENQHGAIVCKLRATLNLLLCLARFLHHTNPKQVAEFINLITQIHIEQSDIDDNADVSFLKAGKGLAKNYDTFLEIYKLYKDEDLADANKIGALNDLYETWLHLSGSDYADVVQQWQRLATQVKLLIQPIVPFLVELEKALNLQAGAITTLVGLGPAEPAQPQTKESVEPAAESSGQATNSTSLPATQTSTPTPATASKKITAPKMSREEKLIRGAEILCAIEKGTWFKTSTQDAAISGLKKLNTNIKKLHANLIEQISHHFDKSVSDRFSVRDKEGMFTREILDTPATYEIKGILNCLWKCTRILEKIDNSAFPTLTVLSCLAEIQRLHTHIKNISARDILQHYIERMNDLLRLALEIFNPILKFTVCEIEKIEIDCCFRPGFLSDKLSLNEITITYGEMCAEVGANVFSLPPFTVAFSALYGAYVQKITQEAQLAETLYITFTNLSQLLTHDKNAYTALEHLPYQLLADLKKGISDSRLDISMSGPYLDLLTEAMVKAEKMDKKSKAPVHPYPMHPALDAFLVKLRNQCYQVHRSLTQRMQHIEKRKVLAQNRHYATLTGNHQMRENIQNRLQALAEHKGQLEYLIALRTKLEGYLLATENSTATNEAQEYARADGVKQIDNELKGNLNLNNVQQKVTEVLRILSTKLYNTDGTVLPPPSTRSPIIHAFYTITYQRIIAIKAKSVPARNEIYNEDSRLNPVATLSETAEITPPSIKLRAQAFFLYLHVFLIRFGKMHMRDDIANTFPVVDTWVQDNVLKHSLMAFIANASKSTLDRTMVKTGPVTILAGEEKFAQSYKAYINLFHVFTFFARTVTQKNLDDMLRSLNNAVGAIKNQDASLRKKATTCTKEVYYSLRVFSLNLDRGWRENLTKIADNITLIGDYSWVILHKHLANLREQTKPSRKRLVLICQESLRNMHFKVEILATLKKQFADLSQKGIHVKTGKWVYPVCRHGLWQVQQLSAMEFGQAQSPLDNQWSNAKLSQQLHDLLEKVEANFLTVVETLFDDKTAQAFKRQKKTQPFKLATNTPTPIREIQNAINIAYFIDLLLQEFGRNTLQMVSNLYATNNKRKDLDISIANIQYQVAVKDVVTELNHFIKVLLQELDELFAIVLTELRGLEIDFLLKQNYFFDDFWLHEVTVGTERHKSSQLRHILSVYQSLAMTYGIATPKCLLAVNGSYSEVSVDSVNMNVNVNAATANNSNVTGVATTPSTNATDAETAVHSTGTQTEATAATSSSRSSSSSSTSSSSGSSLKNKIGRLFSRSASSSKTNSNSSNSTSSATTSLANSASGSVGLSSSSSSAGGSSTTVTTTTTASTSSTTTTPARTT